MLVAAVETSEGNRVWLRRMAPLLFVDLVLSVVLALTVVAFRHHEHVTCQKLNESRAGELALWGPVLAAPRAPLPANATAEQRKAYDDATAVRETFARNLHQYFDPIQC